MNIPCFKSVILISIFFPKSQSIKFTHLKYNALGIHDFQHVLLLVIIFNGKTIL